jgi:hypothetical protein
LRTNLQTHHRWFLKKKSVKSQLSQDTGHSTQPTHRLDHYWSGGHWQPCLSEQYAWWPLVNTSPLDSPRGRAAAAVERRLPEAMTGEDDGAGHVYSEHAPPRKKDEASTGHHRSHGKASMADVRHFLSLLRIMLPGWRTTEGGLLAVHSATLVARTWLSTVVARLDGMVVKAIVDQDRRGFVVAIAWWLAIAL